MAEATAQPRLSESELRKKAQALRTKLNDDTAVAWSRDLQQNLRTQRKRLPEGAPGAVYAAAL
ncbi:MAG: hypothetical protein EBV03_13530, partial [Proteobacteria bacterium]|nr:hypothetical protein [Pseudomonadota bacterium]